MKLAKHFSATQTNNSGAGGLEIYSSLYPRIFSVKMNSAHHNTAYRHKLFLSSPCSLSLSLDAVDSEGRHRCCLKPPPDYSVGIKGENPEETSGEIPDKIGEIPLGNPGEKARKPQKHAGKWETPDT